MTGSDAQAAPLLVRMAAQHDRDCLQALWREVDELHAHIEPGYFRRARGTPRPPAFVSAALDGESEAILVAETGGEVIGLVHVQIYDTPGSAILVPRRRGYVEDLVVAARHRRRGAGRLLMAAAAKWAAAHGARELVLTVWEGNLPALRFYEALGYQALSRVLKRDLDDAGG